MSPPTSIRRLESLADALADSRREPVLFLPRCDQRADTTENDNYGKAPSNLSH